MNNGILNIIFVLLLSTLIMRVFMNIINQFGVDFVGLFEDLWRKGPGRNKTDNTKDDIS